MTQEQIEEYYEGAKEQFELPATRDVRLVLNRDRAKVEQAQEALEEDDSVASWRKVAKQYSTDLASKSNGGLRPGLTEGLVEEPLNSRDLRRLRGRDLRAREDAARLLRLPGREDRARPHAGAERGAGSRSRRSSSRPQEQEAFTTFIDDYGSKWQSRTFCADDFIVERCDNFEGTGRPETAPASCYEESPEAAAGGLPGAGSGRTAGAAGHGLCADPAGPAASSAADSRGARAAPGERAAAPRRRSRPAARGRAHALSA